MLCQEQYKRLSCSHPPGSGGCQPPIKRSKRTVLPAPHLPYAGMCTAPLPPCPSRWRWSLPPPWPAAGLAQQRRGKGGAVQRKGCRNGGAPMPARPGASGSPAARLSPASAKTSSWELKARPTRSCTVARACARTFQLLWASWSPSASFLASASTWASSAILPRLSPALAFDRCCSPAVLLRRHLRLVISPGNAAVQCWGAGERETSGSEA